MSTQRPGCLVAVVGTGTDVGKTWATAQVTKTLRTGGHSVALRKPVQSFDSGDSTTDADALAAASDETPETVCPPHRWLCVPMAPPMATAVLGLPAVRLASLVEELRWPTPLPDVGIVETVGGVRSPVAEDGDSRDLTAALDPDVVVLVADAELGTIDRVRLASASIDHPHQIVFLNRFDPNNDLHNRNAKWLSQRDGLTIGTTITQLAATLEPHIGRQPKATGS